MPVPLLLMPRASDITTSAESAASYQWVEDTPDPGDWTLEEEGKWR